ncbi:MAG: DUF4450 domain-containing protein [Chitinophagaceae bacterium]
MNTTNVFPGFANGLLKRSIACMALAGFLSSTANAQSIASWHNTERELHYRPQGNDFVTVNGKRKFNRALYGTNTAFRVEAGDLPEFGLYMPGMGGNCKLGIISKGQSKWLAEAANIKAIYRPGAMLYEIKDPLLGNGTIQLTVLALASSEGVIIKAEATGVPGDIELAWVFGGASGKKFSRDGDIGADPESSFYLQADYCKDNIYTLNNNTFRLLYGFSKPLTEEQRYEIQHLPASPQPATAVKDKGKELQGIFPGKLQLADATRQGAPLQLLTTPASAMSPVVAGKVSYTAGKPVYILIQKPDSTMPADSKALPAIFTAAEAARKKIADRIVLNTPDPYINPLAGALSIAADAIWEDPSYMHGAVAWRMRLPAWRGAYVADPLGWHDRARRHFSSYALSQVLTPETGPVVADTALHLARQLEKIGTSMFSSGYICRNPNGDIRPHHYDMNLVFIDQLLTHFNWTGDTAYVKASWSLLKRHLAWEKRNFDADNDGLYDAYCCIWASDALQYSGGGVTHSSAYNYRANKMAAMLAKLVGESGDVYEQEADHIYKAMQKQLWMADKGWFAEYKDLLGLQLQHPAAGVWTVYHAMEGGVPDAFQGYQLIQYIQNEIPHIPFRPKGLADTSLYLVSTTNWQPYTWSINNVALAEELHTSLACWQGGNYEEAYRLWRSALLESMYMSASPGGFEQLSFYDAARGELYRDFADPVGMAARSLTEGLFGIKPDALHNKLLIKPGFPDSWPYAQLELPDIKINYTKNGNNARYNIAQSFQKMLSLQLQLKVLNDKITSVTVNGKPAIWKWDETAVGEPAIIIEAGKLKTYQVAVQYAGQPVEKLAYAKEAANTDNYVVTASKATLLEVYDPQQVFVSSTITKGNLAAVLRKAEGNKTVFIKVKQQQATWWMPVTFKVTQPVSVTATDLTKAEPELLLVNHSKANKAGSITWISHAGVTLSQSVTVNAGASLAIKMPETFRYAGTNRINIKWNDGTVTQQDVTGWEVPQAEGIRYDVVDLSARFNDKVTQVFSNQYLSPRPAVPTLQLPWQGIGNWCYPLADASLSDVGLRKAAAEGNGVITTPQGIPFATPGAQDAKNILYTSRWDNYPDTASIALTGRSGHLYLLMAGTTNHMQSRMANGKITVFYKDGTQDSLLLKNPENWWPIEQDYMNDGYAFTTDAARPYRLLLKTGQFINKEANYQPIKGLTNRAIDGGAATVLDMSLQPDKELDKLVVTTLANDVVIGVMSVTVVR